MTHTEYRTTTQHAQPAQARVGGVLRGGHATASEFVCHAGTSILRVPIESVRELVIYPQPAPS